MGLGVRTCYPLRVKLETSVRKIGHESSQSLKKVQT